jgi:hypothetical protein
MSEPTRLTGQAEDWASVGKQFVAGGLESWLTSDVSKTVAATIGDLIGVILATAYTAMAPIGTGMAKGMASAEDYIAPAFAEFAATGINDIFGTNISAADFNRARGGAGGKAGGNQLGKALMDQMRGTTGELRPSDEAAARFVNAVAGMAIEDWFKGWFFEVLTSLVPQLDVGKIENYGALGDKVAQMLGVGRVSRRVLSPIVDTTIVTPLRWKLNQTYRPELLTAGQISRELARGKYTPDEARAELALQGYSEKRIDALLNATTKFHTVGDIELLVRSKTWSRADGIAHLRESGLTAEQAERELIVEQLRRIATFERSMADQARRAFVRREIDEGQLRAAAMGVTFAGQEFAQFIELAIAEREYNTRRLSLGQVEAMVKSGVLSVRDYRKAAEREGYPFEDVMALELQLRYELDKKTDMEAARAAALAEREAERLAKQRAAAARAAEVAAELARAQRGSLTTIERAVVRGLAPIERYTELLEGRYDGDTIRLMVGLVDLARAAYVEQEAKRAAALQRVTARGATLGDVEQAVLQRVIGIDDYRRRLVAEDVPAADVALLVDTLQARLDDLTEAEARRAAAGAAGAARGIDLGRFEQLVLRGRRTLADYEQLVEGLGFDAGATAAMRELLALRVDDARAAADARARAEQLTAPRGVSLSLMRRGVLLGQLELSDYERFMREQQLAPDAQLVLMADIRRELAELDAARQTRDTGGGTVDARELPLSGAARAARLGIVSPDAYEARLVAAGFAESDVAVQMDLLLLEIADVQAKRAALVQSPTVAAEKRLTLSQLAQAVRLGVRSAEDYRRELALAGYAPDAVDTLTTVLYEELAQIAEAQRRRDELTGAGDARALSLGQLEAAIDAGERSPDDYYAGAIELGYSAADAELLTSVLLHRLNAKAAKGAGG